MEGDAFDKESLDLMELREGLQEGLIGMQMLLDDRANSGGFRTGEKVPFHLGGVDFTVLAAKDEEEGWELIALQEEVQSMIHLMQKGLGSDLSFYWALFAC